MIFLKIEITIKDFGLERCKVHYIHEILTTNAFLSKSFILASILDIWFVFIKNKSEKEKQKTKIKSTKNDHKNLVNYV